jgi:hypothetical protein
MNLLTSTRKAAVTESMKCSEKVTPAKSFTLKELSDIESSKDK